MATAFKQVKNNAQSTLQSAITAAATTISLPAGHGGRFPAPGTGFYLTVWDGTTYSDPGLDPGMEIVLCTARSGDTLTVTRAQNSTAATSHASGDAIRLLMDASHITDLQTAVNTIENSAASIPSGGKKIQSGSASVSFASPNTTFVFPSAFNSTPVITITGSGTASDGAYNYFYKYGVAVNTASTTGFSVAAYSFTGAVVSCTFNWIAIGT